MTNCSRSNAAVAPKILKQVHAKLKEIQVIYPGTKTVFILDKNGEVLASSGDQPERKEIPETVLQLKVAALKFADTLQDKDELSTLHIRGETSVFSVYIVNDYILTFYSEMHFQQSEGFGFLQADELMKVLCQDLYQLLHNTKM
eukprot:TRINITY_DN140_c0_g1_i1.p1 TRINITY_DN140_c0_g1~~TRINITY_DN140_c0_g1_i1.p1  ORF type:complete len:144 (+),score=26.74 TRINITY_DN140_c0_g1_i1:409-840(+)